MNTNVSIRINTGHLIVTHVEVPHPYTKLFHHVIFKADFFLEPLINKFNHKILYFYIVGVRVNKASYLHENLGVMFFETS